jgi:hypothetical protein
MAQRDFVVAIDISVPVPFEDGPDADDAKVIQLCRAKSAHARGADDHDPFVDCGEHLVVSDRRITMEDTVDEDDDFDVSCQQSIKITAPSWRQKSRADVRGGGVRVT